MAKPRLPFLYKEGEFFYAEVKLYHEEHEGHKGSRDVGCEI
jgi:hypothetical protein